MIVLKNPKLLTISDFLVRGDLLKIIIKSEKVEIN